MDDAEDQQIAPGEAGRQFWGMHQRQQHHDADENLNEGDMLRGERMQFARDDGGQGIEECRAQRQQHAGGKPLFVCRRQLARQQDHYAAKGQQ
ncbi:hypothetical protein SB00020_02894 [Klebsiella pneumoniae subsp. pneumoniae]|nr:hypothetical protein SB00020_02894 [Klebsiella pneumoniae subsp. pneumoniae]